MQYDYCVNIVKNVAYKGTTSKVVGHCILSCTKQGMKKKQKRKRRQNE